MSSIWKQLVKIKNSCEFDALQEFIEEDKLSTMAINELELLSSLLLLQGADQLSKGDLKVFETFEVALKVSKSSPHIFYRQGQIYSSYKENLRCLYLANQSFQKALEKDPHFFLAMYENAKVLLLIGLKEKERQVFVEANELFEKLHSKFPEICKDLDVSSFYWQWGSCLAALGRIEGEPTDFHRALEKFFLAKEEGEAEAEFFNDYGAVLVDLGQLLNNHHYFLEALAYFHEATLLDPKNFQAWFNQGCCLKMWAEKEGSIEYLERAVTFFELASLVNPSCSILWLKWGQVEFLIAKLKDDPLQPENCWRKFEESDKLEPNQPATLNSWAESELFFGAVEEKLDYLLSAKAKIQKSLHIQSDLSYSWYLYGICLNELGHYFDDSSYYFQAIEKLEYGLSINSRCPLLSYGMALSHFSLGEIKEDKSLIEKSIRFCSRVVECGGGHIGQFWNDWGIALLKLAEMTNEARYAEWAIEKLEKALQFSNPLNDKEQFELEWIYHYGCAFDLLGDITGNPQHFEKAVYILGQVIQLYPEDDESRYNYALALYHLAESSWDIRDYEKSIEQFEILVRKEPEESVFQIDLAVALISFALVINDHYQIEKEKELFKLAEVHLVQACSLGNYQAFYHLAGLYSLNGLYSLSLHFIEKSYFFKVLPELSDLLQDSWLEGLRQTPAFRQFFNGLSGQPKDER